ncbi:potassium channel LctB [Pullulanibacillus pueri]|uniref:Potassium channel domain-containing protein n=1 Tax=Pullulanibacillus pueri TaxID=1437324 RepID=A0A8J3A390_9BACL|nr:potassium channel family protein [Pullulanibacillus pueri]MBM7684204.1 potassium channel LctB [Pullulanibacillus pueri]GGH88955.1 hypothetical protein GCM10007096_42460 [Pullulanibacillus pueri]
MLNKKEIFYNAIALLMLCGNIIISFTFIYIILEVLGLGQIVEHHPTPLYNSAWLNIFTRTLYFSAITLFSVGYGDITPFEWSRMVAIIEATVGYILPAVITVQYLRLAPPRIEKFFKKDPKDIKK